VTLTAAVGWCAPSGARYPAWVLEVDSPWPLPVRTLADYRTWTPSCEQRTRWAEEDSWLRSQLQLCEREHECAGQPELWLQTEYLRG
jgi:hypothetical protein